MITAIIFDLDGLLVDSETYWERTRREYAASLGCDWTADDELAAKGKNSPEWASLIQERCALRESRDQIIEGVTNRMRALYHERLPVLPGALDTVHSLAVGYPLGLASSSPPALIQYVLTEMGILACFAAIVSSDQTGMGKPAPWVFLGTAQKLRHLPPEIAVFEDSTAGIQAGHAAGMHVIAVPNKHYPPDGEALELAELVLPSLEAFSPDMLRRL